MTHLGKPDTHTPRYIIVQAKKSSDNGIYACYILLDSRSVVYLIHNIELLNFPLKNWRADRVNFFPFNSVFYCKKEHTNMHACL